MKPRADFFSHSILAADTEAWIGHAVAQQWVVEDGELLRAGPVSPLLPDPTMEAGRSDGWAHRFLARR